MMRFWHNRVMNGAETHESLAFAERLAHVEARGLLFLHHGRGTSEQDLIGLADVFDPQGKLHVVAPRAPFQLPGQPGYHWYKVLRVGYPDPETFRASRDALTQFHEETWQRTGLGPEQTVLGGFSMGAVMSYAMGLSADRPSVAGILAMSGFIPTLDDWQPDFAKHATKVLTVHGRQDPIISIDFARDAHERIAAAGLDIEYRESDAGHSIDPGDVAPTIEWLARTLGSVS